LNKDKFGRKSGERSFMGLLRQESRYLIFFPLAFAFSPFNKQAA